MTASSAEGRRRAFDRLVERWAPGRPLPSVRYLLTEDATWRRVVERLWPAQDRWACLQVTQARGALGLPTDRVAGLAELDTRLAALSGFRLEPVAGLVPARAFFACLARRRFPTTLYVRPFESFAYTPEPDVIHELLGHAPTLAVPRVAAVTQRFGEVAAGASPSLLRQLQRVYWHALEFGLVETPQGVRALGSGLLSSYSELSRISAVEHAPWAVRRMARTPFVTDRPQTRLFVAASFDAALDRVEEWLEEVRS